MTLDLSNYKDYITQSIVQQKLDELNAQKDSIEEVIFGKCYSIESKAFEGFSSLRSLQNERFATIIGQEAFAGCISLEAVDLRYCVEISKMAFAKCNALNKVVFGPHVIIGEEAFADCSSLKTLKNKERIQAYWSNAFKNCTLIADEAIGNESTQRYESFDDILTNQLQQVISSEDQLKSIKQIYNLAFDKYCIYNKLQKKPTIVTVYRGSNKCYYYMLLEWINNIRQFYRSEKLDIHVVLGKDDYFEIIAEHAVKDLLNCCFSNVFFHINKCCRYIDNNNIFNIFFEDWSQYSNVLYCDVDIVINKPLDQLLQIQLDDNKWLACVPNDPPFKKENTLKYYMQFIPEQHQSKFNVFADTPMFNGGMFMFNSKDLPSIQQHILANNSFIYEIQGPRNQHILNFVFYGKTQFIDSKYNNLYKTNAFNIDPQTATINHYTTTGTEQLYSNILNKLYDNLQQKNCNMLDASVDKQNLSIDIPAQEKSTAMLKDTTSDASKKNAQVQENLDECYNDKFKNTLIVTNVIASKDRLQFDFIVCFDGEIPKTEQHVHYKNEVFPFSVEFSQSISYDANDIVKFINAYLNHVNAINQFSEVKIDVDKTISIDAGMQSYKDKYIMLNSGGVDSLAMNELLKSSSLADDLVNMFIVYDDQKSRDKHFAVQSAIECAENDGIQHFIFYVKQSFSTKTLLFERDNLKCLRFLLSKMFVNGLYITGDVQCGIYNDNWTDASYDNRILKPIFMQSELLGQYILLKKNFNMYLPIIMNSSKKSIHKLVLLKYILKHCKDISCNNLDKIQHNILCRIQMFTDKIGKQLLHSIETSYINIINEYKELLTELYPTCTDEINNIAPNGGSYTSTVFDSVFNNNYFSVNQKLWDILFGKLHDDRLKSSLKKCFDELQVPFI